MISNRKLYRLGVGVALLMSCFLINLVYQDIFNSGNGDVTNGPNLVGYANSRDTNYGRELASDLSDARSLSSRRPGPLRYVPNRDHRNIIPPFFDGKTTPTKETDAISANNEENKVDNESSMFSILNSHVSNKSYLSNTFLPNKNDDDHNNNNNNNEKFAHSKTTTRRIITPSYSKQVSYDKKMQHSVPDSIRLENTNSKFSKISLSKPVFKSQLFVRDGSKSNFNQMMNSRSNAQHDATQNKARKKFLVYLCEADSWCGGWGDRQKGIATTYHLSKILGREFKIVMNTPCSLTKFYQPLRVNWIWKQEELGPAARQVVLKSISKLRFKDKLMEGDFNVRYPHDVIFLKTNQDLIRDAAKNPLYSNKINTEKSLMTRKSRFRSAWKELMQPSIDILWQLQQLVGAKRLIQKKLISKPLIVPDSKLSHENISSSLNSSSFSSSFTSSSSSSSSSKPLICAHVRMGRNPTIPMDEQWDSFEPSDIPKLLKFLKSKDTQDNAEFYLATDYEAIRKEFSRFFGTRLITHGGKILHIDRQRDSPDSCEGFSVAVLDQLVLSVCDILVTSRSGFSIHAAYMSNSTHPAYIMEDRVIKLFKA